MIAAYTALHYGSPYLAYAIRSVIADVDKYFVLYSAHGSHGARGNGGLPESESREALQLIAYQEAGDKLVWIDGTWHNEGQQRDSIYALATGAEIILVVDYDEVWQTGAAADAIARVRRLAAQKFRVPMIHYWRSFYWGFTRDPAWPVRVICPKGFDETYLDIAPINHLGYAIPTWLLKYKMSIHGHRGQWRRDCNWMIERWEANARFDCHPVGSDFWNAEPILPDQTMPAFMKDHPYYELEVIE